MLRSYFLFSSAGVGRTGSFIAVDRLQQYLDSDSFSLEDSINLFTMVMEMRQNRVQMVQTEVNQYYIVFII